MEELIPLFLFGLSFITAGLFLQYYIAKKFEEIAFKKGYTRDIHSFALCFWLGIIGYLYVIALPDLNLQKALSRKSNTPSYAQNTPQRDTFTQQATPPPAAAPTPVAEPAMQAPPKPYQGPQTSIPPQPRVAVPENPANKRVICKVCGCIKPYNDPCPRCRNN